MSRYISTTDTAKLIRKELKSNFPGIKFSVRSRSYSCGASIDVQWTDGPSCHAVERVAKRFQGASFDGMTDSTTYHTSELDGETVHFGADYVMCTRKMSRIYVEAIVAAFCQRWGYSTSKIKITGTDEEAYVDSYALGYSEDHWLNNLLSNTDAKDMHRPYEAQEEREQAEREEWERNEPQRKAEEEREAAEYAKREEVRRQQEQSQAQARKEQEARQQRARAARQAGISTREQALAFLGLTGTASDAMILTTFRMRVKHAADGRGGYREDMDNLVKAKEKALQR